MKCLIVSADLMFVSQAKQVAASAGAEASASAAPNDVLAALQDVAVTRIIWDLTLPQLPPNVLQVTTAAPAGGRRFLAVGPHVHHDKLNAARERGWTALTRGGFYAQAASLFQSETGDKSVHELATDLKLTNPWKPDAGAAGERQA